MIHATSTVLGKNNLRHSSELLGTSGLTEAVISYVDTLLSNGLRTATIKRELLVSDQRQVSSDRGIMPSVRPVTRCHKEGQFAVTWLVNL